MKRLNHALSYLDCIASKLCAAALLACLSLVYVTPANAQGYNIKPGDTLRIEVLEDPSLNRTVLVAPDGRISVPSAGTLRASGQTVESVQNTLTQRLAGNFAATPNVFVAIEQLAIPREVQPIEARTIDVYVVGEANRPGKLEIEPGTTVLQFFAEMGGVTKFAATKRIQLRRIDPRTRVETVYTINYAAIEAGANAIRTTLMDGDVIVIPQRRLFE